MRPPANNSAVEAGNLLPSPLLAPPARLGRGRRLHRRAGPAGRDQAPPKTEARPGGRLHPRLCPVHPAPPGPPARASPPPRPVQPPGPPRIPPSSVQNPGFPVPPAGPPQPSPRSSLPLRPAPLRPKSRPESRTCTRHSQQTPNEPRAAPTPSAPVTSVTTKLRHTVTPLPAHPVHVVTRLHAPRPTPKGRPLP